MKQIGVDVSDPAVVARYDARQLTSLNKDRVEAKDLGYQQWQPAA